MRTQPNIVVCGTPGVGKSSHCEHLISETELKHLAINKVAEERGCIDGRDDELGCWIIDEDKVFYCLHLRDWLLIIPAGR
jgi:adenylate kinase